MRTISEGYEQDPEKGSSPHSRWLLSERLVSYAEFFVVQHMAKIFNFLYLKRPFIAKDQQVRSIKGKVQFPNAGNVEQNYA